MKRRPVTLLLFFLVFLNGCASEMVLDEHGSEWISRPVSELKKEMNNRDSYASKIGWKETTYSLADGNYAYVEPVKDNCFVDWEINSAGIIIGYQAKGSGCPKDDSFLDDRISSQKSRAEY